MTNLLNNATWPQSRFLDRDRPARIRAVCLLLEPLLRAHAARVHVPGVAYGVIAGGELIFTHSFGVRSVYGQEPVDSDTIFRIASMTKSFAAAAILHLRDAGRLRLDEPAASYVPELAPLQYPTTDAAPITVRQLLTMSAGWPEDDPWADRQLYRSDAAMSAFYQAGVSWSNPPGVTFEYSNYGYMVLGRIITNVAGEPAVHYINRTLLQPLGMASTVWDAAAVAPDRLAHGHRWEDDVWKEEELLPCGGDVAAFAGILTSVRDLARWVTFFLDAWPPRDDHDAGPLRRSSRREMQQIGAAYVPELTVPTAGGATRMRTGGYGFGLQINHDGRLCSVGHGGGLPGFGSHMRWLPDYDLGIVVLGNVTYAGYRDLCTAALEQLVDGAQLQPRQTQIAPALAAAQAGVLRLMTAWDDELAATLFADNLLLDSDAAHRQRAFAECVEKHGPLRPDGALVAENWLRGHWRMTGEEGWVDIAISLSPTVPPRVQELAFTSSFDTASP
ncbi:MAG: serine hydrolase domain-containing protein [Caldilineaceae bacterium]